MRFDGNEFPDVEAPSGWEWENNWRVDVGWQSVGEEGWIYSTTFSSLVEGEWGREDEKGFMVRRRRWTRSRRVNDTKEQERAKSILDAKWQEKEFLDKLVRMKQEGFSFSILDFNKI